MASAWLIVGAGVGGLTLAVTFAQQDVAFLIYDQEEYGVELGAGLLLAPNATRILGKLGIYSEVLRVGHCTTRWYIQNQSGAILREIRLDAQGLPAISIHRADLLKLLRCQLPDGCLRYNVALKTVRELGHEVELSMTDGCVVSGQALIGADGIHSVVREHLFGYRPLRYRGYVGWRGIASFVPKGYEEAVLSETWGPGGRFGIAPVGAGRTYWYASANQKESWVDPMPERQANLLRRFGDWHQPIAELIAATPNREILVSRIYDIPKLHTWSRGNITLLGDAAHAMTPNLGQGACLAMEDAWALGSLIRNHQDPQTVFQQYQRARIRRAYSIQRQSRAMGWIVQAESPWALAAREWATPRIPDAVLKPGMKNIFSEQMI